jgi:predicted amino acid dehydrogenase
MIGIPFTADELLRMRGTAAVGHVAEAVRLARERGAQIVGLGAYTSVVTRNGRDLQALGVPLTTGNGYTAAAAVEAVQRAARERGVPLAEATVAVVGATGSVAGAMARALAPRVGRLVLLGNPARPVQSLARLHAVARAIAADLRRGGAAGHRSPSGAPRGALLDEAPEEAALAAEVEGLLRGQRLRLAVDHAAHLPEADVVVTATSSPVPLVAPEMLKPEAIVCDVSRPSNVSPAVRAMRPDVTVIGGGIVELPGRQDLGIAFGLRPGFVYACMAETMVLALERRYGDGSLGEDLSGESIRLLQRLARRHGFRVAHRAAPEPGPRPPATGAAGEGQRG